MRLFNYIKGYTFFLCIGFIIPLVYYWSSPDEYVKDVETLSHKSNNNKAKLIFFFLHYIDSNIGKTGFFLVISVIVILLFLFSIKWSKVFSNKTEKETIVRSKLDSQSALEKTIDDYNKELDEEKKKELYMLCAEELLAGTSDVYLNHKDPTLEMTFAHNFRPLDTGMVALVFTNKEELLRYTKKENPYTVIPSYKIFDLCLHFRLENIFINYKSSNSILIALDIPKKEESEAQDLYYDLVSKGPDAYIEALEAIGWFDLEQKNKNAIRQKLHRYTNPDDYVLALADIEIDGEGFEDIEAYKTFFNRIKAIVPNSKFSVMKDRGAFLLTFTVGNQRYEHTLTIDGDWFQEEILIEWINPALTNSNIHENFYVLPSEDQCLYIVYASNEVYLKALENSVVLPSR